MPSLFLAYFWPDVGATTGTAADVVSTGTQNGSAGVAKGFRAAGAASVLRRNLLIYGLGGFIIPFIGIKLIDMIITALGVK